VTPPSLSSDDSALLSGPPPSHLLPLIEVILSDILSVAVADQVVYENIVVPLSLGGFFDSRGRLRGVRGKTERGMSITVHYPAM